MFYKVLLSVAGAVIVGAASPAMAAPTGAVGPYAAIAIGIANPNNVRVDYYDAGGTFGGTGTTDTLSTKLRLKSAAAFSGALGYDFGMIRADVEVAYSRNKVSGIEIVSVNGAPITLTAADAADFCDFQEATGCTVSGNVISFDGGRVRQLSALGNVWLDIPIGTVVTPYVGAGLGINGFETGGEGKAKFAWQLGAGVAVHVAPSVAITADLRHRSSGKATITEDEFSGFRIAKIKTNTISVGARFTF